MKFVLVVAGLLAAANAAPGGRIIGGTEAGLRPYVASLQLTVQPGTTLPYHFCAATIITTRNVITGANCIFTPPPGALFEIVAGVENINVHEGGYIQRLRFESVAVHPDYPGGPAPFNLAVIRTLTPFNFNSRVLSISLPASGYVPTGVAELLGWGDIERDPAIQVLPETLQVANKTILSFDTCNYIVTIAGAVYDETNLCTGPLDGSVSACTGDAGGPLVQNNQVIGVVSFGFSPCGVINGPTVYSQLSAFADWIFSNL